MGGGLGGLFLGGLGGFPPASPRPPLPEMLRPLTPEELRAFRDELARRFRTLALPSPDRGWAYCAYTLGTKTAVSIPDPIFHAADELARRLGMSRSRLFAVAVRTFVENHDDDAVTAKINEVLSRETSTLDPVLQSIQARSIPRESWK